MTVSLTAGNRRGAALLFTLVVSIAVAAMALGAVLLSSSARLTTRFGAREASMQAAANGGLELIRDSLNHGVFDSLLPDNGFTTFALNEPIPDVFGNPIAGITRSLYVGRTGGRTGGAATAGQYGNNFASGVSVIRDQRGAVAARRLLMTQESWAKFAVAINNWGGTGVYGCSESIQGPFHSNDKLRLQSGCNPKILFAGAASVVGAITNQNSGNYQGGLTTNAAPIVWPTPARISLMQQFAADADAVGGDYDLTSLTSGQTVPGLRIEFLTIDVNGNGTIEWDEGYMRVWKPTTTADTVLAFTNARLWTKFPSGSGLTVPVDPNALSRNCGAITKVNGTVRFYTASEVYNAVAAAGGNSTARRNAVRWLLSGGNTGSAHSSMTSGGAVTPSQRRCFLGGDPALYPSTNGTDLTPDPSLTNVPGTAAFGEWMARRTGPHASVSGFRSDAAYLIPLGRNPNFKGAIFVNGDVAISGRLRGRVSVFATGNIVLADDLLYTVPPGTNCGVDGDIFGAIATRDIVIADNSVQTPFNIGGTLYGGFDDTPRDEQYNMFFLAAGTGSGSTGNFYTSGLPGGVPGPVPPYFLNGTKNSSATAENCAGGPAGCIRITGGLAMGRVDYYTFRNDAQAYGYAEAHAYDKCGAINPPPYFPTTGEFSESRYYEIDPVWLSQKGIGNYFASLRAQ
ncbi:MAG: hypothetical protein SFU57_11380 [Gemmatimonadales bacterium]|nr:hypothetical protein [Gemmatimonadales bacterium]